jgi:hypothetical protein
LPTEELKLLAHVRQAQDLKGNSVGEESAVIICNRLPNQGQMSTVHLVVLEECYSPQDKKFKYPDGNTVCLVSLTSWRFACVDAKQSFKELLMHLNQHDDSDHPHTLRLPALKSGDKAIESYFKIGCVPLSHAMRQGNKTVSWYHGPLVPGTNPTPQVVPTENTTPPASLVPGTNPTPPPASEFTLPVHSADDLLLYNSTYGMFDVSYAAAWELGRLLALQSKSFSISLYNWKRTHAQKIKDAQQQIDYLPLDAPSASLELPEAVSSWFGHLALLEGVPFNYLVPDERLLPPESIRFFQLDPMWMECLMDGAFSIGRVLTTDLKQDKSLSNEVASHTHTQISGFLLRSDVVAGWPGLLVDGYDEIPPDQKDSKFPYKLPLLRMATLSKNILICLFDGIVSAIDLYLKPETLHFGVKLPSSTTFSKTLRMAPGQSDKTISNEVLSTYRTINIAKPEYGFTTSADFAYKMIEEVEKVRFTSGSGNS